MRILAPIRQFRVCLLGTDYSVHSSLSTEIIQLKEQLSTLQAQIYSANYPLHSVTDQDAALAQYMAYPQLVSDPSNETDTTCHVPMTGPDPITDTLRPSPSESTHAQTTSRYTVNPGLASTHMLAQGFSTVDQDAIQSPTFKAPTRRGSPPPDGSGLTLCGGSGPDPLWSISRQEAIRLCGVYEEEIGIAYPHLDIQAVLADVNTLYDALETGARMGFQFRTLPTVLPEDNVHIIKLCLASALNMETSGISTLSWSLTSSVQAVVHKALWGAINIDTIHVYVLLVRSEFLAQSPFHVSANLMIRQRITFWPRTTSSPGV